MGSIGRRTAPSGERTGKRAGRIENCGWPTGSNGRRNEAGSERDSGRSRPIQPTLTEPGEQCCYRSTFSPNLPASFCFAEDGPGSIKHELTPGNGTSLEEHLEPETATAPSAKATIPLTMIPKDTTVSVTIASGELRQDWFHFLKDLAQNNLSPTDLACIELLQTWRGINGDKAICSGQRIAHNYGFS